MTPPVRLSFPSNGDTLSPPNIELHPEPYRSRSCVPALPRSKLAKSGDLKQSQDALQEPYSPSLRPWSGPSVGSREVISTMMKDFDLCMDSIVESFGTCPKQAGDD